MDLDVKSLLVFRDLARTGSFSETGRIWNIAQPTVSLMISRLESSAGLVLFERSPTGARLTSAGGRLLMRANEVCESYLAFVSGLNHIARRMDREVRIGFDRSWFGTCMAGVLDEIPMPDGVRGVRCATGESWSDGLASLQYDVVLASRFLRAGLSPEIQEAVIRHERGITVAWNPDFHSFDTVQFSFPEILRTSVLLPDRRGVTGFSSLLPIWCEHAYGMQPAHTVIFETEAEAAAAAAAGLGVMLGPGDVMSRLDDSIDGLVHVRTFEFLLPEAFTFGVYCRSGELSKEVLGVAAALGRYARREYGQA